jgi:glyoxylase-like metal-dependent hydrolase (beta-lactamase superfamily II)/rhodanese-related sulfurtransferase
MKEIGADDLKRKLESGEPVAVVDIREADEYADWRIEESINLPVYNALNAGNTEALTPHLGTLSNNRPLVAVCRTGSTSKLAARIFESAGFEAYSLAGGMRGWSTMWSEARISISGRSEVAYFQIRRNAKGCLSYLLGSHGSAIVVDPCLDKSVYLNIAAREGLHITHVLETHVHADHISRVRALVKATGAECQMPDNERVNFPYLPLHDGARWSVGGITIEAIATPGHTHESMSYLIDERTLLTGDTLFVESIGRPDLEKGDAGAEMGARMLYHSLRDRILTLSDGVWIFPAHYGRPLSFDGVPVVASLGDLKSRLDMLALDEESFVRTVLSGLKAKPPNFKNIVAINEGKADLEGADYLELEAGPNRCAVR